jgi:hypothetical protein
MVHEFFAYLRALGKGWFAMLTGGIISFSLGAWEHYKMASVAPGTCGIILGIGLFFASFIAWRAENAARRKLENPVESITSLRRRSQGLADDVEVFYKLREDGKPRFQMNDDECGKARKDYDTETLILCETRFKERVRGIALEMQSSRLLKKILGGDS